jgi:hypothetical protein
MTLRWYWIGIFAVFVACVPLFAWDHPFYCDWPNHLGMIGYVGEYLKAHAGLPSTIDTNVVVGRATPMFYGNLYFPILGSLSAMFGPRAAVTIGAAVMLLFQFAGVRALVKDVSRDEAVACAAAVVVTWSIYPLTDLYNRSALTEFFAITALQTGTCFWAFYARDPARRERTSIVAGLFVTLAAGFHPPTALFGGLTFGVFWLASFIWCPDRKRVFLRSLAIAGAAAVVLAPWLYVLAKFGKQIQITGTGLWWFHTSLDMAITRLSPFPWPGPEMSVVSTPNLDPQITVGLGVAVVLLGIVALVARARDRRARGAFAFAALCLAATVFLFVLSVSEPAWKWVPKSFTIVQFPYRLVAFIDMAALGALTGVLAALMREDGHVAPSRAVLAVAVVVAAFGVGLKLPRCLQSPAPLDAVVTDYMNPPRDWYFGYEDYSTAGAFVAVDAAQPKEPIKLVVGAPKRGFGIVNPTHIRAAKRTQISTNVQAFPWNLLTVDGHPVKHDATLVDGLRLATWVDAGEHDIGYTFKPDRTWLALRRLALALFVFWGLIAAFGPVLARRISWRPMPYRFFLRSSDSRVAGRDSTIS